MPGYLQLGFEQYLSMKTKFLLFLIFFVAVIFLTAIYSLFSQKKEVQVPQTTTKQTSFSSFSPGKSSEQDFIKNAGAPASQKSSGDKTYFYYGTKNSGTKDVAVFKNGKEDFSLENIFDSSQGSLDSFRQAFGGGNVYFDGSPFEWRVYPSNGVGIQTDGKEILKILYFVPNNKDSLDEAIKEFGLSQVPPSGEVLRP